MNLFRGRDRVNPNPTVSREEIEASINRESYLRRLDAIRRQNLQAQQPELPPYNEHSQLDVTNTDRDTMDRDNETGEYERMPILFEHDWTSSAAWTAHEEFEGVTSAAEEAQQLFDKVRTWEQLQVDMVNLRDQARQLHTDVVLRSLYGPSVTVFDDETRI